MTDPDELRALIERLRNAGEYHCADGATCNNTNVSLYGQAADALSAYEAENVRLREASKAFSALLPSGAGTDGQPDSKVIAFYVTLGELRAIRAALSASPAPAKAAMPEPLQSSTGKE